MLKEYQIENFKAFAAPVTIPIRPLTLIFGANSSGKSAILQSLLMLKQTLEESDGSKALLPKGSLADLGSYVEFIHGHNVQNEFSFKMTLDSPKSIAEDSALDDEVTDILMEETKRIERTLNGFSTIGLSVHFLRNQVGQAIVSKLDLFFGQDPRPVVSYSKEKQGSKIGEGVKWEDVNKALAIACQTEEGKQRLRRLLERRDYWAKANYDHPYWNNYDREFPDGQTTSDDSINLKGFLPELLNSELMYRIISLRYGNEDDAKNISLFALCAANLMKKILARIDYVRPLRGRPKRHYLVGENSEMDMLLENDSLLEDVNKILSRIGVKYQAEIARFSDKNGSIAGVYGLQMKDTATDLVAGVNDVGFGVSQIFPIVLKSVLSRNALVLVEQPELHLHPALQAELGDMFIESALGNHKNTFIIESHSEHLLLRIMRRMRETSNGELPEGVAHVTPADVCVLFVQSKGTSSVVRHLELDEEGQLLDSWPGGFFEEGYRERFS